jgi:hypothetical protein
MTRAHRPTLPRKLASLLAIVAAVLCPPALHAEENAPLFPFVLPWDDAGASVANIAAWNDAPAGKHGFVTAKDGHLFAGGKRIRFLGVNCCFSGNFPTHDQAEKIAARMAKFGVNCVRLHHMDTQPAPSGLLKSDGLTPDPEMLDRLDFFTAQLKARGIYININLHVGREYPSQPKWPGMPGYYKGVDIFYPPLIEAQRDFARALLTHVNPYTHLSYAADPAVAFIEINNENGLLHEWRSSHLDKMPDPYAATLRKMWNDFLVTYYGDNARFVREWRVGPDENDSGLPPGSVGFRDGEGPGNVALFRKADMDERTIEARRSWIRFLHKTEEDYWLGMRDFIRKELGARSLVIGSAVGFSPLTVQARLDVVDAHAYWCHPHFPRNQWDPADWLVKNEPMAGKPGGACIADLAMNRVDGLPFVVTEYNHSAPNMFSGEAFPLLAAYAALQDWDGIFAFAWSHNASTLASGRIEGFFDIAGHPVKMATLPVAAALFRRADVQPPPAPNVVADIADNIRDIMQTRGPWVGGAQLGLKRDQPLRRPVAVAVSDGESFTAEPARDEPRITSDNGQLVWDTAGVVEINTPRAKGFIGKHGDRAFDFSGVKISRVSSRQGWAFLTLTAMDGADINDSKHILVCATGCAENTGMGWKNEEHTSVGLDWGAAPALVEGIAAQIELPTERKFKVWALDERGQHRDELKTDGAKFQISPEHRTLWYEVAR